MDRKNFLKLFAGLPLVPHIKANSQDGSIGVVHASGQVISWPYQTVEQLGVDYSGGVFELEEPNVLVLSAGIYALFGTVGWSQFEKPPTMERSLIINGEYENTVLVRTSGYIKEAVRQATDSFCSTLMANDNERFIFIAHNHDKKKAIHLDYIKLGIVRVL